MTADRNTGQEACTGAADCPAATHVHGCFADYGGCDRPDEHAEAVATDHAATVRMQLEGTLVGQKGVCRDAALAALSALEQELADAKAATAESDGERSLAIVRAEAAEARITELEDLLWRLKVLEDLLWRLKVSALRGLGGTPDYWVGEIESALTGYYVIAADNTGHSDECQVCLGRGCPYCEQEAALAAGSVAATDTPDEGYAPGMRDHEPDICWRLLGGGNTCIKPRGHDDGDHEPADNTGKEQT